MNLFFVIFDLLSERTRTQRAGKRQRKAIHHKEDAMAWGIVIAAVGLVLMVVLMLEEVEVETESGAFGLPDYEPEYESLTINVADYRYAEK